MSNTTNIFERATKNKLRFASTKGELSTEELWDLSLQSLDSIAKATNKRLKEESEESFIETKTTKNNELQLKLDILVYIIGVKLEAQKVAKERNEKLAKLSRLKELAADKADKELMDKSYDELQALIAETEAGI